MFKKARFSSTRAMAIAPLLFAVFSAAYAQPTLIVETTPNIVKLIGAFKTEAVIEADVINERAPCKPNYPQASLRNSEMGTVKLQLLVNVNGYVSRAKVVETSGFRDLDRAALVGFMGCKFKPPVKDGNVTETWIDVRYVWTID